MIRPQKKFQKEKIMGYLKDNFVNYVKKNKVAIIFLLVCICVLFVSSFCQSAVQTDGWSVTVTDLRDAENEGTIMTATGEVDVEGVVVSGILFVPKNASADNPLPGVVLTHGYLNNREMQLQNAIELARRGFVVLTVDREGHGNYDNTGDTGALMATSGLYDSAKYLYNLDYVDKTKIGVSGHSMGGYTTAMTLYQDMNVGIVSAGLMQAWSTFIAAGPTVDVGFLKAHDDEFFFTTSENGGTISREFLSTAAAKRFVGNEAMEGSVTSGAIYVGGNVVETTGGQAVEGVFRAIYEVAGVHPQNHESVEGAAAVVNFFYNAFGTPSGHEYIPETSQSWWVKEMFSLIGLIALFALIFPLVSLLLTMPLFSSLKVAKQQVNEDGTLTWTGANIPVDAKPLKGVQKHVTLWLGALAIMFFSGFIIHDVCTEFGDTMFPNTQLYPQDTTNWVAMWAVVVALFSVGVILFMWATNAFINRARYKENAGAYTENPFASAKMPSGLVGFLKTGLLAAIVVSALYLILYINWQAWTVDFRIWTFAVKVFNANMLPTMMRYALFFGIFFIISAIFNENYRAKNLPEWASILINVFFNIFGVVLVIAIQYGQFTSTGVLWQGDMALGYIVLIPMIPVLAISTVISRRMTAKTGNMWLGAFINTLLFTIITCANTAASFSYVMG